MVQDITTQSWGSRLAGAFFGILIGLALIILSFVLVFWNEGHGLHTAQSLAQTDKVLVITESSPINPDNNHKAVYFTGLATTVDVLQDAIFDISDKAIKLIRTVEMYQWQEDTEVETEKQMGGSEKEIKTYTYQKVWSDKLIDSANFKVPTDHQNPDTFPLSSKTQIAKNVFVGDFQLPADMVVDITGATPIDLSNLDVSKLQDKLHKTVQHDGEDLYAGEDPQSPKVGDMRIELSEVLPQTVSIIAQQTNKTLKPFVPPAGEPVSLLVMGEQSPHEMIHDAASQNRMITWLIRLASLFMMIIGVALLMRPVVVLADVIPLLGSIVNFGTGLIAFVCGLILWTIATAIAWFAVRPLWAAGLIVGVIVMSYILVSAKKRKQSQS